MRRTKEDAEKTRESLLAAALKLFGENGVSATRLEDIARAAGVSRGALYWHFDGKDDMIIALLKARTDSFFAVLDTALAGAGDPLDRIHAGLTALYLHHQKDSDFRHAMMLEFERAIANNSNKRFSSYLQQSTDRYLKTFSGIIEEGKANGSIRRDIATPILLQYLSALTTGIFMEFRMQNPGSTLLPAIDREAVSALAIETLRA